MKKRLLTALSFPLIKKERSRGSQRNASYLTYGCYVGIIGGVKGGSVSRKIRRANKNAMPQAIVLQSDAARLPSAADAVDLVFTCPPYSDARTYGIGAQRHCGEWIEWMRGVVTELCRVSRGLVLVNCAGVTRGREYQPG